MEIGAYPVRLTGAGQSDPIFNGFPSIFPVFHWHGDTFAIPPGARRLAMDRDCPNQAFRSGRAVGLQFHLEVTPAAARSWADAYKEELRSIGKSKTRLAAECREQETAMAHLARLLLDNFLAGAVA
jgi:GMP synthase-like glutamine amidotransferase